MILSHGFDRFRVVKIHIFLKELVVFVYLKVNVII